MKKIAMILAGSAMVACGGGEIEPTLSSLQENVFQPTCATSSCHDSATKAGGLDMSTANATHAGMVGVDAVANGGEEGLKLIAAGDSANSALVERVSGTELGTQMPQNAAALLDEEIQAIKDWIDAGAAK